jgi:hypothetical protein
MRRSALAAAALVLVSSPSCRKQQSDATAGVGDTANTSATVPAPATEMPDTATGVRDFGFDQRRDFDQSIRQQLADIDQQVAQLRTQVKSRGGAVSDRAVARLLGMRRAVERDLGRVNTATAGNWEQVKNEITQGVDQLNEAIQAAQPK